MKLTEELKSRILNYFDTIDSKEFVRTLEEDFGFEFECINTDVYSAMNKPFASEPNKPIKQSDYSESFCWNNSEDLKFAA